MDKINWNYEPFQIPENLLNEWKKIGEAASKKAKILEMITKYITSIT